MRCRNCDYRLWNLRSPQCPECGTAFRPSQYEFAPGSVQFHCPHCNQAYYGTSEKGHLVPSAFDCVSCSKRIDMDEMILQPAAGLDEDQTRADRVPWLERRRLGFVRAWFLTVRGSMTGPTRLIRAAPGELKVGQAWWFASLTTAPFAIIGAGPFILLPLIVSLFASRRVSAPTVAGMCFGSVMFIIGIILANLLSIVVWGGLTHLLLRITGKPDGSLKKTYQALCYSSGPLALGAVPCLGTYTLFIGAIWWVISAVLMVRETQKVDGGRAALAVLVPPGLATLLLVAAYAVLLYALFAGAGPLALKFPSPAVAETRTVTKALLAYRADKGTSPGHAIELVKDDYLVAGQLVSDSTGTRVNRVKVGGVRLGQFDFMRVEAQDKAVQAALKALPDGTIAHRLGDFVFTYHGIDLSHPDGKLWIVILSPDPTAATRPATFVGPNLSFGNVTVRSANAGKAIIAVGRADSTIREIRADEFAGALEKQNVLRAQYNLPPLPNPATVTHKKPAVADTIPQDN